MGIRVRSVLSIGTVVTCVWAFLAVLFSTVVGVYLYLVVQIPYTMDTFMRRLPQFFE